MNGVFILLPLVIVVDYQASIEEGRVRDKEDAILIIAMGEEGQGLGCTHDIYIARLYRERYCIQVLRLPTLLEAHILPSSTRLAGR